VDGALYTRGHARHMCISNLGKHCWYAARLSRARGSVERNRFLKGVEERERERERVSKDVPATGVDTTEG